MTKKFSDLTSIDNLLAEDILAVVDTSETASRYITLANLTESVFSSAGAPSIINVLNDYNAGVGYGNGLYAGYLWHDEATIPSEDGLSTVSAPAYKDGKYYLEYSNFTNTPVLRVDLKEFKNSAFFLRLATEGIGIETSSGENLGGDPLVITTTNLTEGANLYYTLVRDQDHLEKNFETQFNIYSGGLVGSNRDSLEAQVATIPSTSITQNQSGILKFDPSLASTRNNYIEGQVLRIYGLSDLDATVSFSDAEADSMSIQVASVNFTPSVSAAATYTEMSYRFALFNTQSGEISEASAERVLFIKGQDDDVAFLDSFNSSTFVNVSLTNVPTNRGVLVYRKISSTDANHKLIAVLGDKERIEEGWKDYMAFDYVSWSGKNKDYNHYTTMSHFPLDIAGLVHTRRGWVDRTIVAVTDSQTGDGGFEISLVDTDGNGTAFVNDSVAVGSENVRAVQVYHNDTDLIQNAINSNSAAGKKSVLLNARPYNVTGITLPNNFGILGTRSISKIKKLPWSGGNDNRSSIIKASDATASQISLVGIDIEGNSSYQFLFTDSTSNTLSVNYALDFGTSADSITLDGVRVKNVPAGGLWAPESTDLGVRSGEFINSGVSDRNPYSPISSPGSQSTFITGNKIKNYSEYVDVATTAQGVVTNNIVQNCGSGIYVYGSTFFLSSSNVLMGPAGEFLPSPDILNSAYDSINVNLTAHTSGTYSSDSMVYQENGAAFDLTTTSITAEAPELIYRAFYIQKSEEGVEEAYGTGTTAGSFIPGIRYRITNTTGTTQVQWNTAAGTATVGGQDVIYEEGDSFIAQTAGAGTGKATSGGVDAIVLSDVAGTFRELGEFKFEISDALVDSITDAAGTYSYSTLKAANGTVGSEHVGIAWTASHRNYVKAGTLTAGGSWVATSTDVATFTVNVTDVKYLSVGRIVTINNFGTWRNRVEDAPSQFSGKVTSIGANTAAAGTTPQYSVVITFKGSNIGNDGAGTPVENPHLTAGTGSNGTLNIVDEFILAKGRII